MNVDEFDSKTGEWLRGTGPEADVVISSRIRLARNVAGYRFITKASAQERKELEYLLQERIRSSGVLRDMLYYNLNRLSPLDRMILVERHLISKEHSEADWERGIVFSRSERVSLMINEEDHLRMQVLRSGLELDGIWRDICEIDDVLSHSVQYSFSSAYGYLTACPTNVGTGMRISVMLHLPALAVTREIHRAFRALVRTRFTVRGLYGEGTQALGDLYQISNQTSLGVTEEELLDDASKLVRRLAQYERIARQALLQKRRLQMEDRAWSSMSLLREARTITSSETQQFISQVRVGVNTGIIPGLSIPKLNEVFLWTMPAHLQKMEGRELTAAERDEARARYIRRKLARPSHS